MLVVVDCGLFLAVKLLGVVFGFEVLLLVEDGLGVGSL